MPYRIQSVIFSKERWTAEQAEHWLLLNGYQLKKMDDKQHYYRFRQLNPAYVKKLGYIHFRTKPIGKGIELIIAYNDAEEGGNIFHSVKKAYNIARNVVFGRTKLPPNVLSILQRYGNEPIVNAVIERTPLNIVFQSFANLLGTPYDKLFHLAIVFQLQSGIRILVEKNEVINSVVNPRSQPKMESMPVVMTAQMNLNQVMERTEKYMGAKYLPYNAIHNNCQDYISAILQSNGLATRENIGFVKQNVSSLFKGLPGIRQGVNTLTDLGAKIDVIKQGGRR